MNFIKTLLRAVWAGSVISTLVVVSFAQKAAGDLVHDAQGPAPYQAHIDLAAPFDAVGAVFLTSVSGYEIPASGVLIAPNKVLTAAHVVFDYELQPALSLRFAVGANVADDPAEVVGVRRWVVHPDYYGIGGPADLAVLTLMENVTVTDPVPLFLGNYTMGDEITMVGYGRPGTVSEGYQDEFDGIRRAGVLYPNDYGGGAWRDDYLSARFVQPGWPGYHPLGQMGTPGDSGGGWFILNNGSWELMAVTAINNGLYHYAGRTGALRLDDYNGYRNWVIRQITRPHVVHTAAVSGVGLTPVDVRPYP